MASKRNINIKDELGYRTKPYNGRTHVDVFVLDDISRFLKKEKILRWSIVIRGEHIRSLEGVEEIRGDFGISDSNIEGLGELRIVKGDFWISGPGVRCEIRSLGNLGKVDGDLTLRYSQVTDLGELRRVGGNLSLRDTGIKDLGKLEFVGGNLYLPKRIKDDIDLSRVKVNGAVSYWNDAKARNNAKPKSELNLTKAVNGVPFWRHTYIVGFDGLRDETEEQRQFYAHFRESFLKGINLDLEGNSNYAFALLYDLYNEYRDTKNLTLLMERYERLAQNYPKAGPYAKRLLVDVNRDRNDPESAWVALRKSGTHVGSVQLFEYGELLDRTLLDAQLISDLAGTSHLTSFGRNNVLEIARIANELLADFEREHSRRFVLVFFAGSAKHRDGWLQLKGYGPEYYRQFYVSPSEYNMWRKLDHKQSELGIEKARPHLAANAMLSQLRIFLKNAEDVYREQIGMPKVGEGWISETELYYRIKTHFSELDVVPHGRPKWLGQQSLDVYLPSLNFGVEYQGVQHFKPISVFGGEAALEKNIERDHRKMELAAANGCSIVYVYEGYQFDDVRDLIEERIEGRKSYIEFKHVNRPREAEHLLNFSSNDEERDGKE